jgi:hypothetical protein
MNPSVIERMYYQTESSSGKRRYKGKKPITKGEHFRNIKASNLLKARLDRLKRLKVRYDTRRRAEMPNEADDKHDNMIYANFLGDKYGDNGAHYNNGYSVNLRYCDTFKPYDFAADDEHKYPRASEMDWTELPEAEDDDVSVASYDILAHRADEMKRGNCYSKDEEEEEDDELFQAKRRRFIAQERESESAIFDALTKYFIQLYFTEKTKRVREQYCDEEEPKAKRARCNDESNNV